MFFMPFNILGLWFRGLLAVVILGGGIYLLYRWYDDSHVIERITAPVAADEAPAGDAEPGDDRRSASARRVFRFDPGWNQPTAELAAALALLAWATAGRLIGRGLSKLSLRPGVATGSSDARASTKRVTNTQASREDDGRGRTAPIVPEEDENPSGERTGEVHRIRRPDGTELRVECYGRRDAPPIIFSHGWGVDSTAWFYQKRYLAERFRLIVWDEPGLGFSTQPADKDFRLEKFAADLDAVLALADGRPAILVGHSIGGMSTLSFCKEYPEELGTRVAGLVLVHTTYTNPVRTTQMAALYTALEKPVIVPLLYLTIGLWPLAWAMTWLSYLNGSIHRSTHKSSFSGNETRDQLDFFAEFTPRARPDVLARGMLGMLAFDATATLSRIDVPTLVVVGDEDTTTKPEAGEFIANQVPGGRLATLSPAKHLGLVEHHGQFDRLLAEFAEECQPAGMGG
jgi:pimeloyl-ACP methyl ester carboxylesterase